jgi:glycosyltransferase involved in cell wall biosynthesis
MQELSIVVICKNNAEVIETPLKSFIGITDDIFVYDNGSTDNTQAIIKKYGANLFEGKWEGHGKTKNIANTMAKYDWILSLDSDEAIDEELKNNLLQMDLSDPEKVYQIKFKNFLGKKLLRYGEWGGDKHVRLFNRKKVSWDLADPHNSLILPPGAEKIMIPGFVLHQTAATTKEYEMKLRSYANLIAKRSFAEGKKSSFAKIYLSGVFSFIKNYFLKLGFLDGRKGFDCARINALYTFLKYKKLKELTENRE